MKRTRATKPKRAKRRPLDLRWRRKNLARLVVARHGRLPNASVADRYIEAAAWHCIGKHRRAQFEQWCAWVYPRFPVAVDVVLRKPKPRRVSTDTLGKFLHVSDAERTKLRIWTIGTFDVPWAERIKRGKEKRRLADQARRRTTGARSREQISTEAKAKAEDWKAKGISRATYFRRQKAERETIARHVT